MKTHSFRRAFITLGVYAVVLLALTLIQFSRRTGFTLNVGSLVVSGHYADLKDGKNAPANGFTPTEGSLSVIFGGMEFDLGEGNSLSRTDTDGNRGAVQVSEFRVEGDALRVRLSDASELAFSTAFSEGSERLQVSTAFAAATRGLTLPWKPLRSARLSKLDDGRLSVSVGGSAYAFSQIQPDASRRLIALGGDASSFTYGTIQVKKGFSPTELVQARAANQQNYDEALANWQALAYAGWERAMAGNPDEDTIVSYVAESERRGNYRSAIATAPKAFIDSGSRGFRPAVYFGHLDSGFRSLLSFERERLGRVSRLANERNPDLFAEQDLIFIITARASKTLADDVARFALAVDPAAVTPKMAVGILECQADWQKYRPREANPFDRLLDQARFVISGTLKPFANGIVLPVVDGQIDSLFAVRTGRALARSGDLSGMKDWGDLGRTLILSGLSFADSAGALPTSLTLPVAPETALKPASGRLAAAQIYRLIGPEGYQPHAVTLDRDAGIWAWTGIKDLNASWAGNNLTITASFPAGETHFLILRGIKPFSNIQLYGMNFSTDERFERYDSSGWAYMDSEETLLLKMKHKQDLESIVITFGQPAPASAAEPVQTPAPAQN